MTIDDTDAGTILNNPRISIAGKINPLSGVFFITQR
nr:MAG TPA: hypothetical protein [Caudoviricetes sp.]